MSSPGRDKDVSEDLDNRPEPVDEHKKTDATEAEDGEHAGENDEVEREHERSQRDEDERQDRNDEVEEEGESGPLGTREDEDGRGPAAGEDFSKGRAETRGEKHTTAPEEEELRHGEKRDRDGSRESGAEKDSGAPDTGAAGEQGGGNELVNLFVRNVAKHVMEDQLVSLFSKYGKVDSAVVVRDPHSKECRGFGFVKMFREEEAAQAIEGLRDFEFEGRLIAVEKAKRKAPHSRTPGEYMGIDRRIRDRYAGMKRSRDYGGYGYGEPYGMDRRGGYMDRRYDGGGRGRYEDRRWDGRGYRPQPMRPAYDGREPKRGRHDGGGGYGTRGADGEQRVREREPPVPREPADDYV